ncbi:MAG TPA: peptide ABC transporter substrate-binding protein, partial [Thermoclostridium sp.]|nr:peptide ABC transporter substrate-binding protein [Thermoclostridium sp.]
MKRKFSLMLVLVLVCSLFFVACTDKPEGEKGEEGSSAAKVETLEVCVGPDPDTIDPALNSSVDGATLIIHAFEGLMTLDKDGVPVYG